MSLNRDQQRHLKKHKGHNDRQSGRWKTNKDKWTPYNHNKTSGAGKGDSVRPLSCSPEEYGLRYDLATGRISKEEYDKEMDKLHG